MTRLFVIVRSRVLPAVLTAAGVVLLTAGLLSYADASQAGVTAETSPVVETLAPTELPSFEPPPSLFPVPPESMAPSGGPSASPGERAHATRVVVPALKIDLPVVRGNNGYPLCNVAMYIRELAQPGEGHATYLYAHARDGMFGPIYHLAMELGQGRKMLGMIVQVYTSDDKLYLYEITEVRLHQRSLAAAISATSEELWLQTSEGPKGTPGKTQLRALPISVGNADHRDAQPKPRPLVCG
jgi:hypothetical protein